MVHIGQVHVIVAEASEQLHGALPRIPGQKPAGEYLNGVLGLEPLHHLQQQNLAGHGPPLHVQIVRP